MSKIIEGHLVDFEEWEYYWNYEGWMFEDEKAEEYYNAYLNTPSKQECAELCKRLSGELNVYNIYSKKSSWLITNRK